MKNGIDKKADKPVSIAIETSSRQGSVAVGVGDRIIESVIFDAHRRHAVQLVSRLAELLEDHDIQPVDVKEVYISIGPGSFTGLRIGLTVVKTLIQAIEEVHPASPARCVAVPSEKVVVENFSSVEMETKHLGVVMDAGGECVYSAFYTKDASGGFIPTLPPKVLKERELLSTCPKPVTLTGEGLNYHQISGKDIVIAPENLWYPNARCLWQVARRMAAEGKFYPAGSLQPMYLRKTTTLFPKRPKQRNNTP